MTFEKAEAKAKLYGARARGTAYTYETRVYDRERNDCYVIQLLNGKEAGIAAY